MATKSKAPAPPAEETNALATQGTTEIVEYEDYGDDAGRGYENQDQSDRKLPMLVVLQGNSPEVLRDRLGVPGQLFNTVTRQAYDAVDIVPAITDHVFTEWLPRDDKGQGGGFRGRHPKMADIVKRAIAANGGRSIGKLPVKHLDAQGKPQLDKDGKPLPDHELVETFEVAAILYQAYKLKDPNSRTPVLEPLFDGDQPESPILMPFKSTFIKAYREWNTSVGMFQVVGPDKRKRQVPLFAHRVRITTVINSKGSQSWYTPVLSPVLPDTDVNGKPVSGMLRSLLKTSDARYEAAKLLYTQYMQGVVTGAYETTSADAEGGGASGGGPEAHTPF